MSSRRCGRLPHSKPYPIKIGKRCNCSCRPSTTSSTPTSQIQWSWTQHPSWIWRRRSRSRSSGRLGTTITLMFISAPETHNCSPAQKLKKNYSWAITKKSKEGAEWMVLSASVHRQIASQSIWKVAQIRKIWAIKRSRVHWGSTGRPLRSSKTPKTISCPPENEAFVTMTISAFCWKYGIRRVPQELSDLANECSKNNM